MARKRIEGMEIMDSSPLEFREESVPQIYEPKRKRSKRKKIIFFSSIFLIILILTSGRFYYKHTQTQEYKTAVLQKQAALLVNKISRLILLPTDEVPTIFDVTDPDALIKEQPFFKGSIKGDKLLVYAKFGKAVVYSPTRNIIINAGPLMYNQDSTALSKTTKKK